MNTKICKSCGQTNFMEAAVCSKCRQNFEQTAAGQKAGNTKLYWILGGVGAIVVIGGLLIVAVAAGLYFYKSSPSPVADNNSNSVDNSKPLADNTSDKKELVESGGLKELLKEKHLMLGKFKQQGVVQVVEKEKMIFKKSADEAFAMYSANSKNPLEILFSIAKFSTVDDAKTDVAVIKKNILNEKKGKIIKESNYSDGVLITYRKNTLIGILDCKNKTCSQTIGTDGKKVSDFYRQVNGNVY
jgi:hypothetical protein